MKIVHNRWGKLIDWGECNLPFMFFRKHSLDGKIISMPKWISQKDWDEVCERTDKLMQNLKFD